MEDTNDDEEGESVVLATIESEQGKVEWIAPELLEDEPEVVITAHLDKQPLIHPDFVEEVGAVQAYLALVPEDAALHPALLEFATDDDMTVALDAEKRLSLRDAHDESLKTFATELAIANEASGDLVTAGCSTHQRNLARSFYGAAYSSGGGSSGSKTCGDHFAGFHNKDGDTFYCNTAGGDCDYPLDNGSSKCDPNYGCSFVRGRTRSRRVRRSTVAANQYTFANEGRRYRFAYMNCSYTSNAQMRRKRGSGSWIYTTVPKNTIVVRVGGQSKPAPSATARTNVEWATWHTHQNYNTSSFPTNRFELTNHSNGYYCGDIIQRFDTFDETSVACSPGGKRLCDDNSCSNDGCWD